MKAIGSYGGYVYYDDRFWDGNYAYDRIEAWEHIKKNPVVNEHKGVRRRSHWPNGADCVRDVHRKFPDKWKPEY